MDTTIEKPATQSGRLPRWLRVTLWTAAWVATLLVLAVVIENWLGAREWRAYLEEARAAGESLELATVVPPPAADAENFAAIPLFQPLFDYERAQTRGNEFLGEAIWRDPAGKERLENLNPLRDLALKGTNHWRKGKRVDLAVWQQQLLKKFPTELSPPSTPGGDVLRALARVDAEMEALRAGASRPRSRFPIRYEEHVAAPMPHFNVLMAFGKIAGVRALAQLGLGNADAANADLLLGLRIAEATSEEPLLISQLVVGAQLELMMQPLWEGLNGRRWNDAQLASIEAALARFDLLTGYQQGLRGERSILGVQALDALKKQPELLSPIFGTGSKDDSALLAGISRVFLPAGWVDFNKAHICRYYDRQKETVKPQEHRFILGAVEAQEKAYSDAINGQRMNPRKMIAALVVPQLSLLQQHSALGQATADLARVAVAIERYRLKHQSIPNHLDELAPEFLAKVPRDVVSGEPLRYRGDADGSFALYSVGWNGRDDGGEHAVVPKSTPPEFDWKNGDWPWPRVRAAE